MVCVFNVTGINERDTDVHVYVCAGCSHTCETMWLKAWGEREESCVFFESWKLIQPSIFYSYS